MGFKDDRPGEEWLNSFIDRHSDLALKRRISLESARAEAMNPENISKHSGFVSDDSRSLIRSSRSSTAIEASSNEPQVRYHIYKQLYNAFLAKASELCSDGTIVENGTIRVSTTSGATLTSENTLKALRERDRAQREKATQRQQRDEQRQEKAREREEKQAELEERRRLRQEQQDHREEAELLKIKGTRVCQRNRAFDSREERRSRQRRRFETAPRSETAKSVL